MLSKIALAVLVMANLQPTEATLWGLSGLGGGGGGRMSDSISGTASSNRGYGGNAGSSSKTSVSARPGPNLSQYINDQPQFQSNRVQWNDRNFRNDNSNTQDRRERFGVFSLQQKGVQDPVCERNRKPFQINSNNVVPGISTSGVLDPRRPSSLSVGNSNDVVPFTLSNGALEQSGPQNVGRLIPKQNSVTVVNTPSNPLFTGGTERIRISNTADVIAPQNVQRTISNVNIDNQSSKVTPLNGAMIDRVIDQNFSSDGQQESTIFQNISVISASPDLSEKKTNANSIDIPNQSQNNLQSTKPQDQVLTDSTNFSNLQSNQGSSIGVTDNLVSHSESTVITSSGTTTAVNANVDVGQDLTRLVGNNQVVGDKNKLKGSNNLIVGNENALGGINNAIKGDLNKILGSNNGVIGSTNAVKGNYNGVVGSANAVDGNANGVFGNKNTVQGSANGIWGQSNLVIGNGNSVKT